VRHGEHKPRFAQGKAGSRSVLDCADFLKTIFGRITKNPMKTEIAEGSFGAYLFIAMARSAGSMPLHPGLEKASGEWNCEEFSGGGPFMLGENAGGGGYFHAESETADCTAG